MRLSVPIDEPEELPDLFDKEASIKKALGIFEEEPPENPYNRDVPHIQDNEIRDHLEKMHPNEAVPRDVDLDPSDLHEHHNNIHSDDSSNWWQPKGVAGPNHTHFGPRHGTTIEHTDNTMMDSRDEQLQDEGFQDEQHTPVFGSISNIHEALGILEGPEPEGSNQEVSDRARKHRPDIPPVDFEHLRTHHDYPEDFLSFGGFEDPRDLARLHVDEHMHPETYGLHHEHLGIQPPLVIGSIKESVGILDMDEPQGTNGEVWNVWGAGNVENGEPCDYCGKPATKHMVNPSKDSSYYICDKPSCPSHADWKRTSSIREAIGILEGDVPEHVKGWDPDTPPVGNADDLRQHLWERHPEVSRYIGREGPDMLRGIHDIRHLHEPELVDHAHYPKHQLFDQDEVTSSKYADIEHWNEDGIGDVGPLGPETTRGDIQDMNNEGGPSFNSVSYENVRDYSHPGDPDQQMAYDSAAIPGTNFFNASKISVFRYADNNEGDGSIENVNNEGLTPDYGPMSPAELPSDAADLEAGPEYSPDENIEDRPMSTQGGSPLPGVGGWTGISASIKEAIGILDMDEPEHVPEIDHPIIKHLVHDHPGIGDDIVRGIGGVFGDPKHLNNFHMNEHIDYPREQNHKHTDEEYRNFLQ